MKLSIVTTLHRSEATLPDFIRRSMEAAGEITKDFEIVMVDDGSPDDSLKIALDHAAKGAPLKIVELSRNFGHHRALMTGLNYAEGEMCFLIDSDLEEDPALLGSFYTALEDQDADVVYGYQAQRKGGWVERITGAIAFKIFSLLLSYPVPRNHTTVRLMRRSYVDALLQHRERETVIGGLWAITGFKQLGLPIRKGSRASATYSVWRRWKLLLDSVTSFSEAPLVAIFYLGLAISTLSALVTLWVITNNLIHDIRVDGWVSVMLSVWFLGGLLIFCSGVIGIYISKIFIETKGRPYTIVRKVHGGKIKPSGKRAKNLSSSIS